MKILIGVDESAHGDATLGFVRSMDWPAGSEMIVASAVQLPILPNAEMYRDPREALIEAAKKEGADLMVVGSHGRTGLEKLVMGSVASHVVTHATCSVLVVRSALPRR